LKFCCKINSH